MFFFYLLTLAFSIIDLGGIGRPPAAILLKVFSSTILYVQAS
jgi:hypothetical protein